MKNIIFALFTISLFIGCESEADRKAREEQERRDAAERGAYFLVGISVVGVFFIARWIIKSEEKRKKEEDERIDKERRDKEWEAGRPQRELDAKLAEQARAEEARKNQARLQKQWELKMQNLGLTCLTCRKLALPIPNTENRYRCQNCGHQFAGVRHGIGGRP